MPSHTDMVGLQRENTGNRYILTVIDVFSKFAWAEPLKNKDSKSVTSAFNAILDRAKPRKPDRLQTGMCFNTGLLLVSDMSSETHTDKGKEFFNKEFAASDEEQPD